MKRTAAVCLGLMMLGPCIDVRAEIVQGQLELLWGDPFPAPLKSRLPARFVATLAADDGSRRVLDTVQARRAAFDLYALANRRVAVEFSTPRSGARSRIEAIVAADRTALPTSAKALVTPAAVLGNTRWITIACKFNDIADEQKPVTFFNGQYGNSPGQLGHYWQEVSYGKVNLTGSNAYGWFTLPQPRAYYFTTVDGEEKANLGDLFKDCTAAADAEVNFAGAQGINMMFNGDLDGYAWGGGRNAALDGPNRGWSTTWNPPWAFNNLAPLAHEMGHGYGLPHSDNSDGDDDPYDNPWDVMSDAWSNAVRDTTYGRLPKHLNIRQRHRLGWVDAARQLVVPPGGSAYDLVLDRASLAGSGNRQMILLAPPLVTGAPGVGANGVVQYTVEVRKRLAGSGTGIYESDLAGDAVIIHGLDAGGTAFSMDASQPPADVANNEGSMFKVGETWISADGTRKVTVVSQTAEGFVVRIGDPRFTGGRQAPRVRKPPQGSPARIAPAAAAVPRRRPAVGCLEPRSTSGAVDCRQQVR